MASKAAFYAVARGRQTGVFGSWAEAERLVKGFAGARFRKFAARAEAEAFARGEKTAPKAAKAKAPKAAFVPPRGVVAVYTDGGCRGNRGVDANKTQPAGWGFVAVRDGDVLAERWGPVVLDAKHPHFLGAEKCSNNTGELSGIAEALLWLRDEETRAGPAVLCYDSTYAANITSGKFQAKANRELARMCRGLFGEECVRRHRQLDFEHVKGHSGDVFNDRADALVQRGVAGEASGRGRAAPPPTFAPPNPQKEAIERRRQEALARRDAGAAERAKKRQTVDLTGSP